MKILICDDDISTVDVIQHQLNWTALGISQVLRAYTGEAAIRLIDSQRPEIILCDIGMPKVSGIEVLQYIYDNKIPVAFSFLTCHEEFECARAAIRYGASGYITKPFDMAELNSEVQRLVQQVKSRTPAPRKEAQARQDSVLNNVLRKISNGMAGTDPSAVASLLSRNALELSAQSSWQMVMTCADTTDALQGHWSRELLSYTLTRQVLLRYADRLFFLTDQALQSLAEGEDIMVKADEYIRAHFRENINREDVAAVACITPNYLSKPFRSRKGMNLREYINKIRIDEAKRLLLTTSLSVSEVAGNVGYDNISYFSTVFRKYTGMSPVDWRTASQGGTHEDKKKT